MMVTAAEAAGGQRASEVCRPVAVPLVDQQFKSHKIILQSGKGEWGSAVVVDDQKRQVVLQSIYSYQHQLPVNTCFDLESVLLEFW